MGAAVETVSTNSNREFNSLEFAQIKISQNPSLLNHERWIVSKLEKNILELLKNCTDTLGVKKLD